MVVLVGSILVCSACSPSVTKVHACCSTLLAVVFLSSSSVFFLLPFAAVFLPKASSFSVTGVIFLTEVTDAAISLLSVTGAASFCCVPAVIFFAEVTDATDCLIFSALFVTGVVVVMTGVADVVVVVVIIVVIFVHAGMT